MNIYEIVMYAKEKGKGYMHERKETICNENVTEHMHTYVYL